jgi:uncharacterized protein (TIGR02231 family)
MPKTIPFAASALFLFTLSALAEESRISRVTLYAGSATVERSVAVTPERSRVELTGLPANFDMRSLRVEADPGIRIGEVSVRDIARTTALAGREADLEARIQALKDGRGVLEVEAKSAELVRDFLVSLSSRPSAEGEKRASVDAKAIPVVIEAIRRGGGDALGAIQRVEVKKRALDRQIAALERDLAGLRSGGRDARTLVVNYSATQAGAVRALYHVTNAGWRPLYRASLDSNGSKVELERQAIVTQRTGEDWRGVALRLSTGVPRAANMVDPGTWEVALVQPARVAEEFAMTDRVAASKLAQAPAAPRSRGDEPKNEVTEFQTQFSTEFEVPGRVDLGADGRQVTVSLTRQSLAAKQRVRIVPRRDATPLVTAESPFPDGVWLSGDVQLYRDGSYIGSTYWNTQAKERLVLPFGRDDRIQVTVNRVKNRSGSGGIIGQRAERQVADQYSITSRHKAPVELLVLESSPVSVNDKIQVEAAFEPKPKTLNWEERRGVAAWEQPLAPGQTLKFVADYTISYPKDVAIAGLP